MVVFNQGSTVHCSTVHSLKLNLLYQREPYLMATTPENPFSLSDSIVSPLGKSWIMTVCCSLYDVNEDGMVLFSVSLCFRGVQSEVTDAAMSTEPSQRIVQLSAPKPHKMWHNSNDTYR